MDLANILPAALLIGGVLLVIIVLSCRDPYSKSIKRLRRDSFATSDARGALLRELRKEHRKAAHQHLSIGGNAPVSQTKVGAAYRSSPSRAAPQHRFDDPMTNPSHPASPLNPLNPLSPLSPIYDDPASRRSSGSPAAPSRSDEHRGWGSDESSRSSGGSSGSYSGSDSSSSSSSSSSSDSFSSGSSGGFD